MQNNKPLTLTSTHVFQKKMESASNKFPQVASNNGGFTQYPPPIKGGTAPAPVGNLHNMGAAVLAYQYAVQTKFVCEHHKNTVSYPELSSFIDDLHKYCNLN